jgi:hypothetical protein
MSSKKPLSELNVNLPKARGVPSHVAKVPPIPDTTPPKLLGKLVPTHAPALKRKVSAIHDSSEDQRRKKVKANDASTVLVPNSHSDSDFCPNLDLDLDSDPDESIFIPSQSFELVFPGPNKNGLPRHPIPPPISYEVIRFSNFLILPALNAVVCLPCGLVKAATGLAKHLKYVHHLQADDKELQCLTAQHNLSDDPRPPPHGCHLIEGLQTEERLYCHKCQGLYKVPSKTLDRHRCKTGLLKTVQVNLWRKKQMIMICNPVQKDSKSLVTHGMDPFAKYVDSIQVGSPQLCEDFMHPFLKRAGFVTFLKSVPYHIIQELKSASCVLDDDPLRSLCREVYQGFLADVLQTDMFEFARTLNKSITKAE